MAKRSEARIIITGLSEDAAVSVLRDVKKLTGGKVELDRPAPPDLLEDEFDAVNNAMSDLEAAIENGPTDYYGETQTPAQVKSEVRILYTHIARIEKALGKVKEVAAAVNKAAVALFK